MRPSGADRKYFFLAVNTGYVDDGAPDDRCVEFYAARSGHGLYCSIVGNVVIPNGFGTNDVCAKISSSEAWKRLADSIADRGAKAGIQLSSTWNGFRGIRQFVARPSESPIMDYRAAVRDLSSADIDQLFGNFRRGAEMAFRAGFSHIQVHAAHGYALSLLIDESFSRHCDLTLEKLNRFVLELGSTKIESSLRFSVVTGAPCIDGNRSNLIDRLISMPFSFFDVSAGFYNIDKRLIYPTSDEVLASRRQSTMDLAGRFPDKQFILSGRSHGAWDPSLARNAHIGICRDLISNPNFLRDRAMGCTECMQCHYYSRGERHLTCSQWQPN